MSRRPILMVGQNIGKYRVLDRVGRGGMGTVYRAIDETLHREVAIKVLNAELNDPEIAKRFRAEAITVARLSHPGIATIYELFQHEGQWLMVMEFVRGETLERLIARSDALPPDRAARLCMQSLAALAHAHSMAVVHRDLKPANIMLTDGGDIKIMDFGIARVTGTEHLTNVGFMMGTPAYMAPEQVLGQDIDARADLYAMGVVLYRLLSGQLPFKGESPFAMAQAQVSATPAPISSVRAGLPPWVETVITRSLAKAPGDRFQSAVEFHDALERALTGDPTPTNYTSSAPFGLVMTPPRPMPTGQIVLPRPQTGTLPGSATDVTMLATTPTGMPSGRIEAASSSTPFDPASIAPTIATPTPLTLERPVVAPLPVAAPLPPSPPPAAPAPAIPPAVPPAAPASPAASAPAASRPAAAKKPAAKKQAAGGAGAMSIGVSPAVLGAAAAALVVIVGGIWWLRSTPEPEPPVEPPTQVAEVVDIPLPAPVPVEPVVEAPPPPPPPVETPRTSTTGRATTSGAAAGRGAETPSPEPPADAGRAAGDGRSTSASGNGRRGAAPPVDTAPPVEVTNVRAMIVEGRKADDQEVTLTFANGAISAVHVRSGEALVTVPYGSVRAATHIHARNPRWDSSFAAPPENLDVGGVFRTSRHWLTLQGTDQYWIFRLEDINVIRVIQEVQTRTGVTVRRITN